MSCYHPLKAFQVGFNPSGKPKYKICSYDVECVYIKEDGSSFASGIHQFSPMYKCVDEYIEIPCGKCIGCRLQQSREWATRIMLEAQDHETNLFVTLTYDDDHIPELDFVKAVDPDTGEVLETGVLQTLCKRDLQLFNKRLRKHYSDQKIRFFACGEYGDQTARPHYHVIYFGLNVDDLKFFKMSRLGDKYFISDTLTRLWGNGHVLVAGVTWESAAYVARYVTKKFSGDLAKYWYDDIGLTAPFTVMSRRPGIASNYFDNNAADLLKFDGGVISTKKGAKIYPNPRYFKRKLDLLFPDEYGIIKIEKRQNAQLKSDLLKSRLDIDYQDYLLQREDTFKKRVAKKLVRPDC